MVRLLLLLLLLLLHLTAFNKRLRLKHRHLYMYFKLGWLSQCSVWLRAGRPGDQVSIPGRGKRIFPVTSASRPALGPTQPLVQWVPGFLSSRVKSGRGVRLNTHPHLVPRPWMSRSYPSSPPCAYIGVLWGLFTLYVLPVLDLLLNSAEWYLENIFIFLFAAYVRSISRHYVMKNRAPASLVTPTPSEGMAEDQENCANINLFHR
jgi:hypothetical protein